MLAVGSRLVINDWLAHPELLPPRPCSFVEEKYTQLFALDVGGKPFHDQYVALAPNGVAVVGLAPSHPLIAEHRRATGYRTVPYKYTPADLSHLPAQELALAVGYDSDDGEAAEGADGVPAAAGQGPATAAEQGGTAAVAGAATAAAAAGDDPMQADDPTAAAAPPPPANTESKAEGRPSDTVGPGPGSAAAAGAGAAAEAADHSPFPSKALARVRFDGGGKDRSQTKLSGKKRGQGPHLHPTSVLARLEDADGRRRCGAEGRGGVAWRASA